MIGKVIGTEYVVTVTSEKRLANTAVKAELEREERQRAEWQSQIAHLTGCIAASYERTTEYQAALGLMPKIEIAKEEPILSEGEISK